MFYTSEILSNLCNAAVVAGVVAVTIAIATATAAPTVPTARTGYDCVRPFYTTEFVLKGGTMTVVHEFGGFLPCRETYATDDNGYMTFPEA